MCFVFSSEYVNPAKGDICAERVSFLQSESPTSISSSFEISGSKCKRCGNYLFPTHESTAYREDDEVSITNSICCCPFCASESKFFTEKVIKIGDSKIKNTSAYAFVFDQCYPLSFIKKQLEQLCESVDDSKKILVIGFSDFPTIIYKSASGLVEFLSFNSTKELLDMKMDTFLNNKNEISSFVIPCLGSYYSMNKRFTNNKEYISSKADFVLPVAACNTILSNEVFSITCFMRRLPCEITPYNAHSLSYAIAKGGYNYINFCVMRGFKIASAIAQPTNGLVFAINESDLTSNEVEIMKKIVKHSCQSRVKIIANANSFVFKEIINSSKPRTKITMKSQKKTPVFASTSCATTTDIIAIPRESYSTIRIGIRNAKGVSGFISFVKDSQFIFNPYVVEIIENMNGKFIILHNICNDGRTDKLVTWEAMRKSVISKNLSLSWTGEKYNIEEIKERIAKITEKCSVEKKTCLDNIGENPDTDILRFYFVLLSNGIEKEGNDLEWD